MWLLRSFATIGSMTMLSRIAGLIRDQLMADIMGAGMLADVFNIANRLPNFLRRIFAEGAFNAAFVPMFSNMLATEGKDAALDFASRVQAVLAVVLIALTLIVMLIMPWVILVYAYGFNDDPVKFGLAVDLTRITFGYLLFVALTSLLSGLLNSADKYASAAFVPTLLNLFMIAALLLNQYFQTPAHALAWSVLVAGVAQWLWLLVTARRHGLMPRFVRPRLTPDVVKMLKIMAPVALSSSVAQINLLIDSTLASSLGTGAISHLSYADRLNQLPLGIIGVGVGTALLPMLSRLFKTSQTEAARTQMNRAVEFTMLLTLPAAAALCAIAYPIILVIYEHGKFTAADTAVVTHILQIFALGLPPFVMIKILATGFFANQDTKTPFKIAIACMILNTSIALIFMWDYGVAALAIATVVSGWANAGAMAFILYRRKVMQADRDLIFRMPRLVLATLVMTGILLWIQHAMMPVIEKGRFHAIAVLVLLVTAGLGSYIASCFAMRLTSVAELRALLRNRGTERTETSAEATTEA